MVAELVFVLADFPWVRDSAQDSGDTTLDRPRLPLLETLLARASARSLQPDWRGWLALRAGGGAWAAAAPAATVAAAWELRPVAGRERDQAWLVSPVHYFAGLDSVHLHPAGLLRLDRAEQQALVADFARVFADSPWTLQALDRRELLLWGPAIAASAADPALFAGSDPSPGLPRGEGAAQLRGLGAEIEMWLYEHPLNLERQQRGELPVTTLWPWGGNAQVAATRAPRATRPAQLYGRDTYAEALWRLSGGSVQALPQSIDEVPIGAGGDHIVVFPLLQPEGVTLALQAFEQHWLAGAWRALRRRQLSRLTLLIGPHIYRLGWLQLARVWRARRPWWQRLA